MARSKKAQRRETAIAQRKLNALRNKKENGQPETSYASAINGQKKNHEPRRRSKAQIF